jgi:hypothetical protein
MLLLLLLQIPPPGIVFDRWECFYVTMVNITNSTVVTNSTLGTLPVPLTGGIGFTLGPNDVITCVAVYRFDLPRLALLSDYFPANYTGLTAVLGAAGQPPTNDSCPAVPSQRLNATGNVTVFNPGAGFCGHANRTNSTGPAPPPGTLQVCSNAIFFCVSSLSYAVACCSDIHLQYSGS